MRTRGRGTVVAVVDTGMDVAQPDLAGRLWTNPEEACGSTDTDGGGTTSAAPTGLTARAGDRVAAVPWSAPVDDGGAPVLL
jgi:subtilisin family serine protease